MRGWLRARQQRQTGRHAATSPTGETQMRCADGRYVNTGVPPRFPREFDRLNRWLEKLELIDNFPKQSSWKWARIGMDHSIYRSLALMRR